MAAEIKRVQKEVLRPANIKSRVRFGQTGNVFCGKRWLCVSDEDHARATELVKAWLAGDGKNTHYVHDAT